MMKSVWSTISYFLFWGTIYGSILGGWSTLVICPVFGPILGVPWGVGIGATCGLICGLLTCLIQAYTFHPDIDLDRYCCRLSLGLGALVAVISPIMLILTSKGILWGGEYQSVTSSLYLILSIIAVVFWGGLSAAYVAYGHPLRLARLTMGQPDSQTMQRNLLSLWAIKSILRPSMVLIPVVIGSILGVVIHISNLFIYPRMQPDFTFTEIILRGLEGAYLGVIITCAVTLTLLAGTATLIVFLKGLFFSGEILNTSSHRERLILTASTILFIGLIFPWPMQFIYLLSSTQGWIWMDVSCALLMGFYVYRAFPLHEKDKRKEADSLLLAESERAL